MPPFTWMLFTDTLSYTDFYTYLLTATCFCHYTGIQVRLAWWFKNSYSHVLSKRRPTLQVPPSNTVMLLCILWSFRQLASQTRTLQSDNSCHYGRRNSQGFFWCGFFFFFFWGGVVVSFLFLWVCGFFSCFVFLQWTDILEWRQCKAPQGLFCVIVISEGAILVDCWMTNIQNIIPIMYT